MNAILQLRKKRGLGEMDLPQALRARRRREDMKFQKLGDVHVPGLGVPGVPCKVYRSVCHQV